MSSWINVWSLVSKKKEKEKDKKKKKKKGLVTPFIAV